MSTRTGSKPRMIRFGAAILRVDGPAPFRRLPAEKQPPHAGAWIVVDAKGANALRFLGDGVAMVFFTGTQAHAMASVLNEGSPS